MQKLLKTISSAKTNWKTTVLGWVGGIVIIGQQIINLLDGNESTIFSLESLVAGLAALGIGTFARDQDKSSEESRGE